MVNGVNNIQAEAVPKRLRWPAQIGLLMGPFLSMMDSNIVNVALPDIAQSLHADLSTTQWVISGYLLAIAAGLAATAYLAKRFGARTTYFASMFGFTAGSLLCAISWSAPWLIVSRVLQGAFGAPLIPLSMGMLLGGDEPGRSRDVPPALGMLLFLAPAIGPTIGGLLLHEFGWSSVFLINVPLGFLGTLAVRKIPASPNDVGDPSVKFDPWGLLMLAVGLAAVVYGASVGPVHGWRNETCWPLLAVGAALIGLFVAWSRRHLHPVVDLGLLRAARTALSIVLCVWTSVVMFSVVVLVPVFMESVQGCTPFVAGMALFPQAIVTGVGTVLGSRLAKRIGVHNCAALGMAVMAVGTWLLWWVQAGTPAWLLALMLTFRGVATGLVIQPLLMATLSNVNGHQTADLNTIFSLSQRLAGAVGIALLSTLFEVRSQVEHSAVRGFHQTVIVITLFAAAGVFVAIQLRRYKPCTSPNFPA